MFESFHVNYPLFVSDFCENWLFLGKLAKSNEMSNFTKIRLVRAQLFDSEDRTDTQTRRIY